nr:MAG TPA: minor tail protein [Caudoviricetes sp.]
MQRETIINDLFTLLKPLCENVELFLTPAFERKDLPIIIIKDTDDTIENDAFVSISHALSVEVRMITAKYNTSNEIIKAVLNALKGYKSKFLKIEQTSLNRESFELYDDEYILSTIALKIYYKSELWEA